MHTHGNPFSIPAANFYGTQMEVEAQAKRMTARRRVRKVSEALAAAGSTDEEASLLIHHWMGTSAEVSRAAPMLGGDEYRPAGRGHAAATGEDEYEDTENG